MPGDGPTLFVPTPPPRCIPCGKRIFATQAAAIQSAMTLRLERGLYRDEYRCPRDALGGWHLRDLMKRYEKIREHGGAETDELLAKIRRLDDVVPKDANRPRKGAFRDRSLEAALRKLPSGGKKAVGRRGQLRRKRRHLGADGAPRAIGTRGTSVSNELRRRTERARLREELLREEKENGC